MSSVVISGDTSGAITLAAPAVSGTNTATLPAATGTVMVSGNMPAFAVYMSAIQNISNTTVTKISFDTKVFDTNSYWNTSTYRFTPLIAGYYQFNGGFSPYNNGAPIRAYLSVYKNGSEYSRFNDISVGATNYINNMAGSTIVYCNGSTDYVELWGWINTAGTPSIGNNQALTYFNGCLIRTA